MRGGGLLVVQGALNHSLSLCNGVRIGWDPQMWRNCREETSLWVQLGLGTRVRSLRVRVMEARRVPLPQKYLGLWWWAALIFPRCGASPSIPLPAVLTT
jgi:hypothetical protein